MVNDHRTELKIPDVQRVMDGDIDPFIEAYLSQLGSAVGAGAPPRERRSELRPARASRETRRARRARHRAVRVLVRPDAPRGRGDRAAARRASRTKARRVRVAGRIVGWRAHGKTTFAHLADDSGRIQLYFKKDQLGDDDVRDARSVRHRRRDRRRRAAVPDAHRRSDGARDRGGAAREVAPAAAVRQGRDGRRRDRAALGIL